MVQRIQTLWLLIASACAFATLKLSFYSGHRIDDPQKNFVSLIAISTIPLTVLAVAVAIASLVLIFLYGDRKMQMKITIATLLLSILNLVLYFVEIRKFISAESSFDLTCVFAFAVPIFLILAFRGIYKDQKLVKSADRLR